MLGKTISLWIVIAVLVFVAFTTCVSAQTIFVDIYNGSDTNSGTREKPLKTIKQAAELVNNSKEEGPSLIKIAPGVYNLSDFVLFENKRSYTKDARLVIEATILPDDPGWTPLLIPVIISTAVPTKDEFGPVMYGFKIEVSHATIRGLKFLGNPIMYSRYYPIWRAGDALEDLVVTQCMFVGDEDALPIHLAVIANGHGLVVDHCVFYNCKNTIVFWNAKEGKSRDNAMKYCIVDGAYVSGIWTCQTTEDFEFHHNIITRSEYFWMRDNQVKEKYKYKLADCIVTDNKFYSGGFGPAGTNPSGPEITFDEKYLIKKGKVTLEKNPNSREYLHVVPGTPGRNLGAGLFFHPKDPAITTIKQIINEAGIDAAIKKFNTIKASNKFYFQEDAFNALGYKFIGQKKIKDAISIFKMNVEIFPKSANAYDSLGESYMNNNEKELAIKNFKKSLELNPNNQNAIKMLKKLGKD
jgi:hypothetical protein